MKKFANPKSQFSMDTPTTNPWQGCIDYIKQHVPSDMFNAWFEPLSLVSVEGNELKVGVPSKTFASIFDKKCVNYFMQVVRYFMGNTLTQLSYVVIEKQPEPRPSATEDPKTLTGYKGNTPQNVPLPALDSQLNPRYRFENFVMGESNKLSLTIAQSISETPGRSAFNPFFLYGPSGVGKTHLVNAIGVSIKEREPLKRVLFVSAHVFKTQYTDSVIHNTQNDFLNFYQSIDVLIIDDIQEITTSKTQMAFFHIFNHLQQNNRQIIITCDRPPVLFEGIEERMLTRFKWGMVVEMEKPDTRLRRDILVTKIKRDGLTEVVPTEVVQYIAQNVDSSVRELEGIINSIMAYSVVDNCEIDLKLTQRVVARAVNLEKKGLSGDDIIQSVGQRYGLKPKEITSRTRKKAVVQARQITMYLIHKYTDVGYSQIGRQYFKCDHSTVIYACNKVKDCMGVDKNFRRDIEELESVLK